MLRTCMLSGQLERLLNLIIDIDDRHSTGDRPSTVYFRGTRAPDLSDD
ncbi:hypothetical protein BDD14_4493 [Edaphobacter modestus]|uniref:Uncharacterized protein n=1 Tax=Edaphobacter modestus TaxID=388466 RepID=A0A4Q7YZF2_9BACT|nr:hypothetical protein BDD14_4493 [Edaphobacter modestus]